MWCIKKYVSSFEVSFCSNWKTLKNILCHMENCLEIDWYHISWIFMSQFGFFFPCFVLLLEVLACNNLCPCILTYFPLVIILFMLLCLPIKTDMTNSEVWFWCWTFQNRYYFHVYFSSNRIRVSEIGKWSQNNFQSFHNQ